MAVNMHALTNANSARAGPPARSPAAAAHSPPPLPAGRLSSAEPLRRCLSAAGRYKFKFIRLANPPDFSAPTRPQIQSHTACRRVLSSYFVTSAPSSSFSLSFDEALASLTPAAHTQTDRRAADNEPGLGATFCAPARRIQVSERSGRPLENQFAAVRSRAAVEYL